MNKKALSLTEIMISIAIAAMLFVPLMTMFSSSATTVQKTRNFSFAVSLARRISQHMMAIAYKNIEEVPLPGKSVANENNDPYFNPLLNFDDNISGVQRITAEDIPELYNFIKKFNFCYSISISNVCFGDGDEIKYAVIMITWNEKGKDMIYRSHVYIPSI
jgi:type II secretory pathway pseudopilin PulG